ncbi:hypothetical protein [Roseateles sp. BYS96W]|uniref:Uncharacterized protein n=1 Tax=Pelomonas nitida TaxID=3299027 RepID=A0ABW7G7H9_9BURK
MATKKPTSADASTAEPTSPADAPAAAELTVLLLRAEHIDGVRYAADTLLTLPASRVQALVDDGAVDQHPEAIEAAAQRGAASVVHVEPAAEAQAAE